MTKQMVRGIRAESTGELAERLIAYLDVVNANPVPFRGDYRTESAHAMPPPQAALVRKRSLGKPAT